MATKVISQEHLNMLKNLLVLDKYVYLPQNGDYRPFDLFLSVLFPKLINPELMPKFKLYKKEFNAGMVELGAYNGAGAAPPKNTWQYFVIVQDEQDVNISDINSSFDVGIVSIGSNGPEVETSVYVNFKCVIADWHDNLKGRPSELIQTTHQNDALSSKDAYLNFKIDKKAEVFVAYQKDIISLPDWLNDWNNTGIELVAIDQRYFPGMGNSPLKLHLESGSGSNFEMPAIAKAIGESSISFDIPSEEKNVLFGLWTVFINVRDINLKPAEGLGDIDIRWDVKDKCLRVKLIFESVGPAEIEVVYGPDVNFSRIEAWVDFIPEVVKRRLFWKVKTGTMVTEKILVSQNPPVYKDIETDDAKEFGKKFKDVFEEKLKDYSELLMNALFAMPIRDISHPANVVVFPKTQEEEAMVVSWDAFLLLVKLEPKFLGSAILFGSLREDIYSVSLLPLNLAYLIPDGDKVPNNISDAKKLEYKVDAHRITDRYVLYDSIKFEDTPTGPMVTFEFEPFAGKEEPVLTSSVTRLPYLFDLEWVEYKNSLLKNKIVQNLVEPLITMKLLFDIKVEMHHKDISPSPGDWVEIFKQENQENIVAIVDNKEITIIPGGLGDFKYYLEQGGKIRVTASNVRIDTYKKILTGNYSYSYTEIFINSTKLGECQGEFVIDDNTGLWPLGGKEKYVIGKGRTCNIIFRLSRQAAPKGYDWVKVEFTKFNFDSAKILELTRKWGTKKFRVVAKVNGQIIGQSPVYTIKKSQPPNWKGMEGTLGGNEWTADFFYPVTAEDISLHVSLEAIPVNPTAPETSVLAEKDIPRYEDKGKASEKEWGIDVGLPSVMDKAVSVDGTLTVYFRLINKVFDEAKVPVICKPKNIMLNYQKVYVKNDKDPWASGEPQFYFKSYRKISPNSPDDLINDWKKETWVYSGIDGESVKQQPDGSFVPIPGSGDTIPLDFKTSPQPFNIGNVIKVTSRGKEMDLGWWLDPHDYMGSTEWEHVIPQGDEIEAVDDGNYSAENSDYRIHFRVFNTEPPPTPQLKIHSPQAGDVGTIIEIAPGEPVELIYSIPWCSELWLEEEFPEKSDKWLKVTDLVIPKLEGQNVNLPNGYKSPEGIDYTLIFTLKPGPQKTTCYRIVAGAYATDGIKYRESKPVKVVV